MLSIVGLAYKIAKRAHQGKFRRDGKTPYFAHPLYVSQRFALFFPTRESDILMATALLHDVIEDNPRYNAKGLLKAGIPKEVVDAVVLLTKDKNNSYLDYLLNLKNNEVARKVKIQDIRHNLQTSTGSQKEKYQLALHILGGL